MKTVIVPDGSTNSDKPYFGELVVPKESAYVGEQIPIELRFYFNQRMQYQPYPQGQYPLIDGEGFVIKKYSEPTEKQFETNGRVYHVVVYKTGFTGVKPGKLDLQSATQSFLISSPSRMRNAPGFIDPTEAFQQQVVDVKTNGASIDIKPLPTAGRPTSFNGAVGDFTLATSAQPTKARTGDPISMKIEIKGLGNFDRIEQPPLTNTEGWRSYQPSEETQAMDDLGLSAVKIFNFPLVAEKPVTSLPTVEFSYFDPNAEKYVTVKSAPIHIEIEGEQLPGMAASPVTAQAHHRRRRNQTASDAGRARYSDAFAGSRPHFFLWWRNLSFGSVKRFPQACFCCSALGSGSETPGLPAKRSGSRIVKGVYCGTKLTHPMIVLKCCRLRFDFWN